MRQVGLLPPQAHGLLAQGVYHLCQLVLEDSQVTLAIIGQVDGAARTQHLVHLTGQVRHLAVALLGDDRKEDDARRPRNPRPYGGGATGDDPGGHGDDGHANTLDEQAFYKRGIVQGLHGRGLSYTGVQGRQPTGRESRLLGGSGGFARTGATALRMEATTSHARERRLRERGRRRCGQGPKENRRARQTRAYPCARYPRPRTV